MTTHSKKLPHKNKIILTAAQFTKSYREFPVVNSVSFDLAEGEILGIIGPNGAGKTTLMKCLAGMLFADEGAVHFKGVYVPPTRRREVMFYLPDGVVPWSDQPVWRVTGFFRELHEFSLAREAEVVHSLQLTPVLTKKVHTLSKGYHRRLLLALALLTPQPVLILDEPFDGFDLRQTLYVMDLLREVSRERSLILSIHQLRDAERICDRIMLMDAGQRVGLGTLNELAEQARMQTTDLEEVFLGLTQ